MDYKKELIKRIKFIIENAKYLIKPINDNLLKTYFYLEENNNELLQDLEYLLLSDEKLENNEIYKNINILKNDNKEMIIDDFKLLSIIRKFIVREKINYKEKIKKLSVIDEYFRIIRYQNNEFTYISGAELMPIDIRNHIIIRSGVIRNGVIDDKDINYSKLNHSGFMDFISNMDNHYQDNMSILKEKEKQDIYLSFHDEIPWNMVNNCTKSDLFFSDNYCNKDFYLNEEDIFYFNGNYYMMCPNCYNIVLINSNNISDSIKKRIRENNNDKYYLRNAFYKREYLLNEKKKILMKK